MPGIADAEGRRSVTVRLVTGPDAYREIQLTAIPDFEDQRLDLVTPRPGMWPPKRGEVEIERSHCCSPTSRSARRSRSRPADGEATTSPSPGSPTRSPPRPPSTSGGVFGYVTFETLADLGFDDTFDELRILVDDPTLDRDGIRALTDDVRDRIEATGPARRFALVQCRRPASTRRNDLLQGSSSSSSA